MALDISARSIDRSRLYVLIDALEADLRDMIAVWVLPFKAEADALGNRHEATRKRAEADPAFAAGPGRLIDYMDFHDAVAVLNRHSAMLPNEIASLIREATPRLDQFVGARNRVMHGRPLHADDLELGIRLCLVLTDGPVRWPTLESITRRLADPDWIPAFPSEARVGDRVLHNLPLADYDETGLLGRAREEERVTSMLLSRRYPVVTIVGEGGIGKTALAVDVLYDLIENPDCPYEALLWASLKSEVLTSRGIEQITNAACDTLGITRALANPLDADFPGGVEGLVEVLAGSDTLIVIDNLETADASEILRLHEQLPDGTEFLFTSRVGLGELERRVTIGPLDSGSAQLMLRKLAERRELAIAKLGSRRISEFAERLRHNPLAIRWFVEAVDAGAEPAEVLSDQSLLLDFCMASIYGSLAADARHLLATLFATETPVALGELAVLSDLESDALRRALHEIHRRSLIDVQPSPSGEYTTYALGDSAREYLRTSAHPSEDAIAGAEIRLDTLRRSDERRRRDEVRNILSPNSVMVLAEEDRAAAHLVRQSLSLSKRGDIDGALGLLARGRQIAPEYFEIPRAEAFVESRRHPDRATASYREAYDLARSEEKARGKVAYFFASHLAHGMHDPEAAAKYAEEAHRIFRLPATAVRLGQIKMYLEALDEAEALFRSAATETPDDKARRIAYTHLLSLGKRRIERVIDQERRPAEAVRLGLEYLREAMSADLRDVLDRALTSALVELASEIGRAACKSESLEVIADEVSELLAACLERADDIGRSEEHRWWVHWINCVGGKAAAQDLHDLAEEAGAVLRLVERWRPPSDDRLRGTVASFSRERGYGFIESAMGERLFFPGVGVRNESDQMYLLQGAPVSYVGGENEEGPCAVDILVELAPHRRVELGRGRTMRVHQKHENHAFARDAATAVSVYVNPAAFAGEDFRSLAVGDLMVADVEVRGGRTYLVSGSARITRDERQTE